MTREEARERMKIIKDDCYIIGNSEDKEAFDMAIKSLEQDRPIGHWKKESIPRNKTYYMCSECGRGGIGEYSYCPNCGSKMEKAE